MCWVRLSFFIMIFLFWDSKLNHVSSNDLAFDSLEAAAGLLFFTLTSILILFWAEVYYISIDNPTTFTKIVRPSIYILNVVAYSIALLSTLFFRSFGNRSGLFSKYTYLLGTLYIISAILFFYFARAAANELMLAPIYLSARRNRLRILKSLASIFITSLVTKACILYTIGGDDIDTSRYIVLACAFVYFFMLEVLPTISASWFYAVETVDTDHYGDLEDEEIGGGGWSASAPLDGVYDEHEHDTIRQGHRPSGAAYQQVGGPSTYKHGTNGGGIANYDSLGDGANSGY